MSVDPGQPVGIRQIERTRWRTAVPYRGCTIRFSGPQRLMRRQRDDVDGDVLLEWGTSRVWPAMNHGVTDFYSGVAAPVLLPA